MSTVRLELSESRLAKNQISDMFIFRIMDLNGVTRDTQWLNRHYGQVRIGKCSDAPILLIGDSIMVHVQRYPRIEKEIIKKKCLNFCSRGDKIENLIWKIKNDLIPKHVRSIVVHIGTNNLKTNTEEEICDGLGMIVGMVMGHQGALSNVHLVGLIPREFDHLHPFRKKIIIINRELERRFKGWGVFVKLPGNFVTDNGNLATELYYDHLHLSELGLKLFFETVTNYINCPYKFFKKRLRTRRELDDIKALPRTKIINWFDYRQFKVLVF